jgi:hypothetical protein
MCSPPLSQSASAYPHKELITGEVIGAVALIKGEVIGAVAEKYGTWYCSSLTLGCWGKTLYFFVD